MHARENFTVLKQIWPFLVVNWPSARNTFPIWNDLSIEVKSSKSYEIFKKSMPTPNAGSLFHVLVRITLICL